MNLLIVAATDFEIGPLLKKNISCDILITGVGIPATVFHLTKKLFGEKYDLVIQAGISGAFDHTLKLSEFVAVKQETFADLGIEENGKFYSLFEKGFINKNEFPFENGCLNNNDPILEKINLPFAKGITVNKIGDDVLQNQMMKEKLSPHVESMEGAAFHYVCLHQKINFLQLRSISNYVGERDKSKWELKKSIENLNSELIKIIEKL
jgi:futalosine hydrolase